MFRNSFFFPEEEETTSNEGEDCHTAFIRDTASERVLKEYDGPFFHLRYPAVRKHCEQCHTTKGNLSLCAQCQVVYYCCRGCQQHHWVVHRAICRYTCSAVKQYQSEELALQKRKYFDDPLLRTNFSNLTESRAFLQALSNCIEAYISVNTEKSLQEAVKLGFKALYHCRKDDMCFRYVLPALLLRLDMDQECFDMILWYAMYGKAFRYDNPNKPFLSLWGNDRASLVDHMDHPQLTFIMADVILKHRLLVLCRQKEALYTFILCMDKTYKQQPRGNLQGVYRYVYKCLLGDKLRYAECRDPVQIDRTIYKTMKQGEKVNRLLWKSMANSSPIFGLAAPEDPGNANSFREVHFHLVRFKCLLRYIPDTLQYIAAFCQKEYGEVAKDIPGAVLSKAADKEQQHQKKKRR
ncbi:zinc finger MYND domain-containing protein [archaeon]|nr:MAG: zinc finger MYND domain-containing protein [archaeon]